MFPVFINCKLRAVFIGIRPAATVLAHAPYAPFIPLPMAGL